MANKMRELRKKKKLTLDELSVRVGCAKSTLSDIENDNIKTSVFLALKISKELGRKVEYIWG